jgi:REP element-mobilizing transposase RayT
MASTFASVYYHVVFSTRDRYPHIGEEIRSPLHEYIAGIIRQARGIPVLVGGTADHVHVLFAMKTEPSLAAMVNKIKANSSKWVHETFPELAKFAWQTGYGVFSVSKSNTGEVTRYIAEQEAHHRRRSFQEELLGLLRKHGVEYDERYIWT